MSDPPGVNVAGPVFTIVRSAPGGVTTPTLSAAASGRRLVAAVPVTDAELLMMVESGVLALTVTSNETVTDPPPAILPRSPVTPPP